jgi:hypothetical protein
VKRYLDRDPLPPLPSSKIVVLDPVSGLVGLDPRD